MIYYQILKLLQVSVNNLKIFIYLAEEYNLNSSEF